MAEPITRVVNECIDANPGETIENFARRLVWRAKVNGTWVVGIHNDTYLRVHPTSTWPVESPEPCSCGGRRWVEDENWQPEDYERARGRSPGSGLIPCGFCNEGGWHVPVGPEWPEWRALVWTTEPPSEPGWYWRRFNGNVAIEYIPPWKIAEVKALQLGWEFSGPIPEPAEATE